MPRRPRSHVRIFKISKFPGNSQTKTVQTLTTDKRGEQRWWDKMSCLQKRFYLFNCDNTYNLEIVKKFLVEVEEKYGFKFSIDRLYFGLPRMAEVCDRIIPTLDMDVAVFVVHANESRLSINEDNAGIGYARIYRALLENTDYNVLILIGGDSYYRDENEEARSVISRWARRKVASQFREEYLDGRQSFIFSWDGKHRMIHEEAMRHFLDPGKRGSKFEYTPPRPLPEPIPPVIPHHLSKPLVTFAGRNVRQESSLVETETKILIQDDEADTYGEISSVIGERSIGVEVETVLLETKVRYGEISYNDEDVLQRKDGWRPSERQESIVMEDLEPYAVRTVKFFSTGDDPAVEFSYDKLRPSDPQEETVCGMVCGMVGRMVCCMVCGGINFLMRCDWREAIFRQLNEMSTCQKCMLACCCCFYACCYFPVASCLDSLCGWCTDRFRVR